MSSTSNIGSTASDRPLASPPSDSISSLEWSPTQDYLTATSWDGCVRIWEVNTRDGASNPKAETRHDKPVLDCCWASDGMRIISAGCDNQVKMWPLGGGQPVQIGVHDAPVKSVCWMSNMPSEGVFSGSWDRHLRFWDTRDNKPQFNLQQPERIYDMDYNKNMLAVATAERWIVVYDVRQFPNEFHRFESPLKCQTRCIQFFQDASGLAIGSIEGRVAIRGNIQNVNAQSNFQFKCHRDGDDIYAVNAISFHPTYGTFSTAGADGAFHFWDKDRKQRLKQYPRANAPVSATSFSRDGSCFAYALSYDWSKGVEGRTPGMPNEIRLHLTPENSDIKPKNDSGGSKYNSGIYRRR